MPATQILRASEYTTDKLATAFTRGFEQYYVPHAMTPEAMAERVVFQDVVLEASFVLQDGDGPAGLALLSARGARSWCCALGVAADYRGGGYGRILMERLIEEASLRKLREMWLEVFTQNTPAFQLYQSLGFRIERELTDYAGELAHGVARRAFTGPLLLPGLSDSSEGDEMTPAEQTPVAMDATAALAYYEKLQLVRPSWEFEQPVLARLAAAGRLQALVIPGEEASVGPDALLLSEARPSEVRLLGFAARPGADAAGGLELATALLGAVAQQYPGMRFHAEEIPPGDPLGPVLEAAGCPVTQRLFEMALTL
ncbi:MAG TPA: GNAT family N-acetyltransferase [Ktedonobacterales bacterium]|jgi:ribosomal protein S18 acetylase RimI-like enzyme